jgi:CRP-like cAMP-binding protein
MITDENILLHHGGYYEDYPAKEIIFHKGDVPHFFIQICSGTVELNNYHEDGREFTLNILSRGDSIGESLLFGKKNYPMYAVAKTDCTVIKLAKSSFLELVRTNRDISVQLLEQLSDRLYYKYTMLFNNSSMNATAKITSLLDYYKECAMSKGRYNYHLPLTRQQIANLTGLRVETVIRTIKKMEAEEIIHINERQIYY